MHSPSQHWFLAWPNLACRNPEAEAQEDRGGVHQLHTSQVRVRGQASVHALHTPQEAVLRRSLVYVFVIVHVLIFSTYPYRKCAYGHIFKHTCDDVALCCIVIISYRAFTAYEPSRADCIHLSFCSNHS